nr:cytochrome P450 6a13 [Geocoris pallidipennis]
MILEILLCLLAALLLIITHVLYKKMNYFYDRNIPQLKPIFFFGHSYETVTGKKNNIDVMEREYRILKNEDIIGHLEAFQPNYMIRNPEYVQKILIKDFAYFHDRLVSDGEIKTPFDANLFLLGGNLWRAIRNKFSPLFTTGKLKYMYHSMADCGKNLISYLDKKDGMDVEITDVMGLFAMDVIGSTTFGIEPTLLNDPSSKFREMGKRLFDFNAFMMLKTLFLIFLPKVAKFLGLKGFFDIEATEFFYGVIRDSLEYRKREGFERNDFVQMLLQLKEKGRIELQIHDPADDYLKMDDKEQDVYEVEMSDNILIGGAFSFLFAGFHASAMTLSYTLFELSQHPEVVKKLREEIKERTGGGEPTYEDIKSMTYLEQVVKETLRLHPSAGVTGRVCTKEYTFPNGVTVVPGENLIIPVAALQKDPAYWTEPEVFNPDRWNSDFTPRPGTYLPFGDGPRVCIAMRFAMMEIKFAVALLIQNYDFKVNEEKTQLPLKLKPRAILATPDGGITFTINKISG